MENIQSNPELSPVGLTNLCAQYLKDRFQIELSRRTSQTIGIAMEQPLSVIMLPINIKADLDGIANILVNAFLNRGK
jgi:hypothetical protein